MELTEERIKEFKALMEKQLGKEVSWSEAAKQAHDMAQLAKLLLDLYLKDKKRQERLKAEPKGFHLEGGPYTCFICGWNTSGDDTWYDKWGIKCMTCQEAVNKRLIPASLAKNKDGWYALWEFDSYFGLKAQTLRKLVRQGKLESRVVPAPSGRTHCEVFLIKDNPGILPPKPKRPWKRVDERTFSSNLDPFPLPEALRIALGK